MPPHPSNFAKIRRPTVKVLQQSLSEVHELAMQQSVAATLLERRLRKEVAQRKETADQILVSKASFDLSRFRRVSHLVCDMVLTRDLMRHAGLHEYVDDALHLLLETRLGGQMKPPVG